jgi:hypothetical protein
LLLINESCSKEVAANIVQTAPDQTINATVSADNAYTLNVAELGEVSISRQALHFDVSQIEIEAKDRTPVYKYIPATGFTGTDEVELFSSKTYNTNSGRCNGGGERHTTTMSSIIVKFTVTK